MAGRRVIVVGAGQENYSFDAAEMPIGNGRASAQRLAQEGAVVVCADLYTERAEESAAEIRASGGSAVGFQVDATDEASMGALFDRASDYLGGLDGLLMNVGMGFGMWMSGTSVSDWDRTFAVNTRSHFLGCKLAMDRMTDDAAVVLVSSVASLTPGSRIPAYDSSKAALAGLARHAAFEGRRRRIRFNVLAPGLIDTPIGREATRHRPGRTAGALPLGRQGSAWDVANGALYLLSEEASYVNGQVLAIDGGLTTIY